LEKLFETQSCQLQTASLINPDLTSDNLQNRCYKAFIPQEVVIYRNKNMSMKTSSIKQLISITTPVYIGTGSSGVYINTVNRSLYYTTTNGYNLYNYLQEFKQVFRFWRGGLRFIVDPMNTTGGTLDVEMVKAGGDGGELFTPIATPNIYNSGYLRYLTHNISFRPTVNNPIDFILPYYNTYNCQLTKVNPGGVVGYGDGCGMAVNLSVNASTILSQWFLGMSAADDFIFGYQLGIPMATTTLTY